MIAGCGIRFEACEAPRPTETLPVKLWACNAVERRCEVYARFKTTMDCGLYQRFLGSECDPNVPPGHLRCTITGWSWAFGDGYGAYLQDPVHAFSVAGTHTVTLTVRDSQGKTSTLSQPVTVIGLTATGNRIKGDRIVNLSWSGASGNMVDVSARTSTPWTAAARTTTGCA